MNFLKSLDASNFYKRWGNRSNPSEPDISGCMKGRRVEIEVKLPGKKLTPGQEAAQRRWKRAGAVVGVAHSVEDAEEILRRGGLL